MNEAREILVHEEAQKLIDMDEVHQKAIEHAEQSGIIFIDEIDKVCGKDDQQAGVSEKAYNEISCRLLKEAQLSLNMGR